MIKSGFTLKKTLILEQCIKPYVHKDDKRKCCVYALISISLKATGWTTGVRFPAETGIFSPRHRLQKGSG